MSKRGFAPRSIFFFLFFCRSNADDTFVYCRRGGAAGNKLKMTLGLPVYAIPPFSFSPPPIPIHTPVAEDELTCNAVAPS